MTRHTPGPWFMGRLYLNSEGDPLIHITGDNANAAVANVYNRAEGVGQANARLIAAAPALLEAAEAVANELQFAFAATSLHEQDLRLRAAVHPDYLALRAAIAAAKGGAT